MRYTSLILSLCMLLGGCMQAQDSSTKALDSVEKETSSSWQKLREILDLGGKPATKSARLVQPRYCYRAFEDVICYSSPVAGQESRLVAYQDTHGTGYTIDPPTPPSPKKQKLLPKTAPVPLAAAPDAAPKTPVAEAEKPATTAVSAGEKPPEPTPAPTPAPTPVPVATQAGPQKPDEKRLKEITFDPSELEPKKLVPDKIQ